MLGLKKSAINVSFSVLKVLLLLFISLFILRSTTFISSAHSSILVQTIVSTADSASSPCIPIMASVCLVYQQYLLSHYYVPVSYTGKMLNKSRRQSRGDGRHANRQ